MTDHDELPPALMSNAASISDALGYTVAALIQEKVHPFLAECAAEGVNPRLIARGFAQALVKTAADMTVVADNRYAQCPPPTDPRCEPIPLPDDL